MHEDPSGTWTYDWRQDADVRVRARLRTPGGELQVRIAPLLDVLRLATEPGLELVELSAPDTDALVFEGIAYTTRSRPLSPADVSLPPTARTSLLLARVLDLRGLAAVVVSKHKTLDPKAGSDQVTTIGQALVRALTRTNVAGAQKRVRLARARLAGECPEEDDAPAIIASAVARYFASGTPRDDGPATLEFTVAEDALDGGEERTIAQQAAGGGEHKRRAKLFADVLRALEQDAFGSGVNSARASRAIISGDAPVRGEGSASVFDLWPAGGASEPEDFAEAVADRLDQAAILNELRAHLRPDERALLAARYRNPDLSLAEIAARQNWAPGVVVATWKRIQRQAKKGSTRGLRQPNERNC